MSNRSASPQEVGSIEHKTIVDLFFERALKSPHHTALVFKDHSLTYQDLDEASNQLAHYLQKRGVQRETLVPIIISPCLEMVIGILGILKAGGAYVPVNPSYPAERIAFILEDIDSHIAIAGTQHSGSLNTLKENLELVFLDETLRLIKDEKTTAPELERQLSCANLAYIIYTSGSTGKPKGVMIEHGSVVPFIKAQTLYFGIKDDERILQFSNFCFDASVEQLFLALLNGSCLVLLPEQVQKDMEDFSNFLISNQISHLHATPGFLEQVPVNNYPSLRRVISGGELCKTRLAEKWTAITRFYNEYGPTETTVTAVEYECIAGHLKDIVNLPIGKTLSTVSHYILNEKGEVVASGDTGELHLGGVQVARGYLNRPELTKEKFIASPFLEGERLYKTGDLVKELPDGNIEFLGRIDEQVKIRGYRIELGEIENTLQDAPGVKQCAVITKEDTSGSNFLVSYIVPEDGSIDRKAINAYLLSKLPDYMVPQLLVPIENIPLNSNGKIDKKALPQVDASELISTTYVGAENRTETILADIWKVLLQVKKVGMNDNFFELGGNSILAMKTVALLKEQQYNLPITKLYQYPTVSGIAAFLDGNTKNSTKTVKKRKPVSGNSKDVAVIGMACRFPGADTINELWEVLTQGKETISFFTDAQLDPYLPATLTSNPDYVKARGVISGAAFFDAAFFGINPRLAELMDPQQRIFLVISRDALEATGYLPGVYEGSIGVFAGTGNNTYYLNNVLSNRELVDRVGPFLVSTLNEKDYIATRTAYELNLEGPAVSVYSACSTSLLAIAQAVESIRTGQCDIALAGGASVTTPINSGHLYEEGAILSRDGHCRSFDAEAAGTVFSDGAGVVLLKSLEDAERDGDLIYAVVKGIGVNNDGGGKGSFTAPSAEGQAGSIKLALQDGDIDPSSISYIEAHGTATPLGDPIEIDGLNIAFGPQEKKQFCAIGSIKSNMGHLTSAAGVAGFIKTVLSLHHRKLLPSISYTQPNPNIDFKNSPFFVNTLYKGWDTDAKRTAGVSSFGVGGTNVHTILEEYQNGVQESDAGKPVQLITWSAKTPNSLEGYAKKLSGYLLEQSSSQLADIAYTLQTTRQTFKARRFIVAASSEELLNKLSAPSVSPSETKVLEENLEEVAFLFPGQGSQYVFMGADLYKHEPVFRDAVDECAQLLEADLKEDIRAVIFNGDASKLNNTYYTQPALFVIEYALAKLWMSWGIRPSAFAGHSIGEFVAAHLSGIVSLKDGLHLIATRGRLMANLPAGSMLSVRADYSSIISSLPENISLAAINSPGLCVVAGPVDAIKAFSNELEAKDIQSKLLHTSHAFHSSMMDPIVAPFEEVVRSVKLHIPRIPIVSTVTGKWMTDTEATDPAYWANHLRATVRFADAMVHLQEEERYILLETGPRNVTITLARQQAIASKKKLTAISTLDPEEGKSEYYPVLKAAGQLWLNGISLDWDSFYSGQNRIREILPTYAYEQQLCWVNPIPTVPVTPIAPVMNNQVFTSATETHFENNMNRKNILIDKIKTILEDASGIEMQEVTPEMNFIEIGLDSLLLTQVAQSLKKEFKLPITFRKLNEEYNNLDLLAAFLDVNLPQDAIGTGTAAPQGVPGNTIPSQIMNMPVAPMPMSPMPVAGGSNQVISLISQQIQLLAQQIAVLQGGAVQVMPVTTTSTPSNYAALTPTAVPTAPSGSSSAEPEISAEEAVELKKPFGATARIDRSITALSFKQQEFLNDLVKSYTTKTKGSKEYTQKHRARMADPRVVSGFRPSTKEMVYSIVMNRSKGSRLWDIDGNEYIDMLNGFGSNMLGYQPEVIKKALLEQVENGYEIGPQHELAGEVCDLVCEFTGFDRVALCNTGSEAVLGAMRIARTVTGRSLIVAFANSYHGIVDEVIVRGSKKGKTFPAASGIMPEAVQNMLILEYGTQESLRIIRERADELAAVLVEPVQSRRPEFQPVAFLKEVRKITEDAGTPLIFDEVISGFRFHPGGTQAMFGIKADIATYGKVVGGGISIGIIAGKRYLMDALDGGFWQFGDDSVPEIGVTYFAGTFVRHPLALATTKASLLYMKEQGPALQERLTANATYLARSLETICRKYNTPMYVAHFCSIWKIKYYEEYAFSELLFLMMREKGIHIQDGFPCYLTIAHTKEELDEVIRKFEECVKSLKEAGFIPEYHINTQQEHLAQGQSSPISNAKLGKDKNGDPAWFVPDEKNPGKYLLVQSQ